MAENSLDISVVLPFYNAAATLSQAIESVLEQRGVPFELVLIDDGSSDGSPEIAARYASDPRVRLISHPNKGLSASLNIGVEQARADLIARMDADDVSLPGRLEHQVQYLRENPDVVLLGGQMVRLVGDERTTKSSFPVDHERIVSALLQGQHAISHPTVAFRKDAVLEVGGYWNEGLAEDWDLYLKLAEHGRLANLRDTVLDYRYHGSGINADSMRTVRTNIALAVENHRRRQAGLEEYTGAQFRAALTPGRRFRIAAESRSLSLYRASLAGHGVQSRALLACAAAAWPPFAWRRITQREG
ncbi:glycosyltransferase [Tsukamurella sp. 8F]|uniref:glycosyltransferase family 2 protein n=1 Tax=unclassified Tsukamurella TaxID=2633480 RepID=UPI0023B9C82B|nr:MULTISPECIES: glycosyltransferase [unclassified Tsukamurella]MDF0530641.1 glycosyltransferase [Tsukamurella sp. 8J]MDF0587842.1 glycosyltransferase [Tsukamurella sp. 8F]